MRTCCRGLLLTSDDRLRQHGVDHDPVAKLPRLASLHDPETEVCDVFVEARVGGRAPHVAAGAVRSSRADDDPTSASLRLVWKTLARPHLVGRDLRQPSFTISFAFVSSSSHPKEVRTSFLHITYGLPLCFYFCFSTFLAKTMHVN